MFVLVGGLQFLFLKPPTSELTFKLFCPTRFAPFAGIATRLENQEFHSARVQKQFCIWTKFLGGDDGVGVGVGVGSLTWRQKNIRRLWKCYSWTHSWDRTHKDQTDRVTSSITCNSHCETRPPASHWLSVQAAPIIDWNYKKGSSCSPSSHLPWITSSHQPRSLSFPFPKNLKRNQFEPVAEKSQFLVFFSTCSSLLQRSSEVRSNCAKEKEKTFRTRTEPRPPN